MYKENVRPKEALRKAVCWGVVTLMVALWVPMAVMAEEYVVVFENENVSATAATQAVEEAGGQVMQGHFDIGVAIVQSDDPNFEVLIEQNGLVEGCAENATIRASSPEIGDEFLELPAPAQAAAAKSTSTSLVTDPTQAPFYPFQWNMRIMGADQAWAAGYLGDPSISVAVVDTGLDYNHPELVGRVNLDKSKSFVPEDDIIVEQEFPGEHPIADLHFHGTYVAALIGCNAAGIACVSPNVDLIGVKVLNSELDGTVGSITSGIRYAGAIRSDVIVLSFDMFMSRSTDEAAIKAIRRAIRFAWRKGSYIVGELGGIDFGIDLDNDDPDQVQVPAEISNKLTVVSASGPLDEFSNFSNYGLSVVDMSGPGGFARFPNSDNAVLGPCSSFTIVEALSICRDTPFRYVFLVHPFGAAAHVGGAAALVDSQLWGWRRGWRIRNLLNRSVDDIGEPGRDAFFGRGRVNVMRALELGDPWGWGW